MKTIDRRLKDDPLSVDLRPLSLMIFAPRHVAPSSHRDLLCLWLAGVGTGLSLAWAAWWWLRP